MKRVTEDVLGRALDSRGGYIKAQWPEASIAIEVHRVICLEIGEIIFADRVVIDRVNSEEVDIFVVDA